MTEQSTKKDPAFLAYATAWLQSESVNAMTLEQQGAYWRLLCFAWLHEGVPSDESALQRMLGLSRSRFRAVWAGVSKCWQPSPSDSSRLVNERQERERAERKKRAEDMRDLSRRGVEARRNRAVDRPVDRAVNGTVDHSVNPSTSTSTPSSTPSPSPSLSPQTNGTSSLPVPLTREGPEREGDDCSAASGRRDAEGLPEAETGPASIWAALRRTPYRENSEHRDRDLMVAASRLERAGIGIEDLVKLAGRAKRKGKNPNGLFAHWIDDTAEALKELSKR